MPKTCSAYGCSNRWEQNCKLSFHRFPKNQKRRELWTRAIARQGWIPTENSTLCGGHFVSGKAAQDWDTKSPDWVPSVFNVISKVSSMPNDVDSKQQPNKDAGTRCMKLPDIKIGKEKSLRYLRICCPLLDVVSAEKLDGLLKDNDSLYLFLGSDVLHGSSVCTVHHPRTHARFAKRGFACKLHFSKNVKINGVHGISHGIWFYTIQGVFRVLFELHDRSTQYHCMKELQELWLASFADRIVPESLTVTFEVEETSSTPKDDLLSRYVNDEHTYSKQSFNQIYNEVEDSQHKDFSWTTTSSESENTDSACDIGNKNASYEAMATHKGACNTISTSKHIQVVKGHNSSAEYQYNKQEIEDEHFDLEYCSGKSLTGIKELLENITKQISHLDGNSVSCLPLYPLKLLTECIHHARTSQLSEQVCRDNMFEFMLNSVCRWLGIEFNHLIPNVLQKADEFKSRHIESIENLPSAGEVVTEIFHSAMETLLVNWMGIHSNQTKTYTDAIQQNDSSQDEICSSRDSVQTNTDLNTGSERSLQDMTDIEEGSPSLLKLYPLIQLILELANQTLISGMAHVVFARLAQQETVMQ
ncbi:uncharacterized protein LOC117114102 [Anneissia japonica]|uniref:uncharacterized protein LOC117114102 n=1 Tax=Anneissia japonica TaxID=1529436 RepID=UPI0014257619|nr:uncharacterized protein LOC117114102 [Anneissia japonica]